LVELLVGQLAPLVSQRNAIAVADRADGHRPGEQAVALNGPQHLRHPVWQLGAGEATSHAQRGEIRLVSESLGELAPAGDDRPEVGVYDRVLLTSSSQYAICGADGVCAPRGGHHRQTFRNRPSALAPCTGRRIVSAGSVEFRPRLRAARAPPERWPWGR